MTILVTAPATGTSGYTLRIAADDAEIRAAQRLRFKVFAEELGAHLATPVPGLDIDQVDQYADHLIVVEEPTDRVVGTYRMLPPDRAAMLGRLYSDGEFNLSPLAPLRDQVVETGRSCVDAEHRSGAVINMMWAGIARYLHLTGYRWLIGCASVPVTDGGAAVAEVVRLAHDKHLAPPTMRVTPRRPWAATGVEPGGLASVPPLLKGYLRLGAWICGEPAYDPDFNVADFLVLLSLDRIHPRYLRHFLGETSP
jgi:putative hemolysin